MRWAGHVRNVRKIKLKYNILPAARQKIGVTIASIVPSTQQ
jgi:hypothetical protein